MPAPVRYHGTLWRALLRESLREPSRNVASRKAREGRMTTEPDIGTGASLDTLADNRAGRATGLTTLTPLPRLWAAPLKLLLRVKTRLGPDKTLRRLSFIHVAYWVLIDRFPLEQRRSRYSYL